MSKIIKTSSYLGYPINNKYTLKQSNMKDIYLALVHARDSIDRPLALRYTLGLIDDHSFDIKKLTRKIRTIFKDAGYSFIYSFEHAENRGLHLEMILVINQAKYSPLTIFNLLRKIFFNMDGIEIHNEKYKTASLNFHERKEEYITSGSKVGHSLKKTDQFSDCVYRASYLAKQEDKLQVKYKKTFGTITG